MNNLQTQVLSFARPVRLAFFFDLADDAADKSHSILDEIFRYSFSIWGGRFSLLIPCENGIPLPQFIPWLKAFDPDVIYSYVNLSDELQNKIHEDLYPSFLQFHGEAGNGQYNDYRPEPNISSLVVTTLLPILCSPGLLDNKRGLNIINLAGRLSADRFLTDSFGLPSGLVESAMRRMFADSGAMLTAIDIEDAKTKSYYIPKDEGTVTGAIELLTAMSTNNRIQGVNQLSAFHAPRLNLNSSRWTSGFNIVVGDTVSDRVLYWNSRSLMSPYRDGTDVDLCIPRAKFEDPLFVAALKQFLNKRNQVNGDSGGPHRAIFRSISVSKIELAKIAEIFKKNQSWIGYESEHLASVIDCIPDAATLERKYFVGLSNNYFSSANMWKESISTGTELRISVAQPDHLRHAPASLADPHSGAWAVDLDIERTIDNSDDIGDKSRWRFPRRLRVTQAFIKAYQIKQPHGQFVEPRITAAGRISIYSVANVSPPKIHIPTDHHAIVTGLVRGRDWHPFERFTDTSSNAQICYRAERSGAGRYFWGVYQLFGDLNVARSFFLHEFWRKQLEYLGATDQRTDVRQDLIKTQLLRRIGGRVVDLSNDAQLSDLSDLVMQESDSVRTKIRSLKWTDLVADHISLGKKYDELHPSLFEENEVDESVRRLKSLQGVVKNLCKIGVLHQGYEIKCSKCLYKNWFGIEDLKRELACSVCKHIQLAPVSNPWQFRLNGFLHQALQRYGIGPLFWVLGRFQQRNIDSFWFEGPLDIYFDKTSSEANKVETDIDLTIINGGKVHMCEVKQSERAFQNPEKLADVMTRLRPDVAIIAVMENKTSSLEAKFEIFTSKLKDTGIKPRLITLDASNDLEIQPYFYF